MLHLPPSSRSHTITVLLALVSLLWLTGCNGCQAPPIVDVPASSLDVKLSVLDITENSSDGKLIVVMQFSQNGKTVKLASPAVLSCNGVTLTYNDLFFGYVERVPILSVGGVYTFRHSRNGVNTNASVTAAPRPVFSAPTIAGATLARTNNFTIHYVAGTGIAVRGDASSSNSSKNNTQPDDGTHDGLDVSGFAPGPGSLSITRILENAISGTGFLSAIGRVEVNKKIDITWQ